VKKSLLLTTLLFAQPAFADEVPGVDETIAAMSLQEKAAQLQSDAPAIERLGLPAYEWWNEGLHGLARNGIATVFPQAIGLAATWDAPLLKRVGDAISTEARGRHSALPPGKGSRRYEGLTIWSPNVNIFRDPRWGRGQETYGEDPFLTGRLAVSFVTGLQGPDPEHPKVIATPKHLAVHSGPEAGRDVFDVDVSPQDMEATYLPAFRMAIVEGKARSVMCAYNSLHGVPACASESLLDGKLRKDWGFEGLVVSDCDAVSNISEYHFYRPDAAAASAAAIKAGMDLNCGRAYAALPEAVASDLLAEADIDTALKRAFHAREALGIAFGGKSPWSRIPESAVASKANSALALEAARKSITLLENSEDFLPLRKDAKLAVIGPNADSLAVLEANYHGTAADPVTPLQGLRTVVGAGNVAYAQGSTLAEGVAVTVPETALRWDGQAGLMGEYFAAPDFSGKPVATRIDRHVDFDWDRASPVPGLPAERYAVRWTGEIVPPGPGDYVLRADIARCFDCSGHDPVRVWIDGKLVIDDDGSGGQVETRLHFDGAAPRSFKMDLVHDGEDGGIRLQWVAPASAQLDEAEAAMRQADVVIAVVGLSSDVEGEALRLTVPGFDGGDRTDIALPAPQRALLARAAALGKPLVIVLASGSAVALDPADYGAKAMLAAWYPGQAGGIAIAETLSGRNNPAGRLPVTFYRATSDLPAFVDYRMAGRTYRYFTGKPLYPFGHGLSYTRFAYGTPRSDADRIEAGTALTVAVPVTNSGARGGDEVVQAYLVPPAQPVRMVGGYPAVTDPILQRQLAGFERITLKPGETREVHFTLDPRAMSIVDRQGNRFVAPGRYRLFIGGGQPDDAPGQWLDFTVSGTKALPK
jgi:beta-glucosidase